MGVAAGRLMATPLARAIARAHGLELATVAGSGPGGRVMAADARALIAGPQAGPPVVVPAIARSAAMPVATVTVECDVGAALGQIAALGPDMARPGLPLSLGVYVAATAVALLPAHPLLNARWATEAIVLRRRLHLAMAEWGPHGLRWAMVRDAGDLTLRGLARALARASLELDEATFSVISLANGLSWWSTPPPRPATAATLAVGAPRQRAVVGATGIAVRPLVTLTVSYDARVLDHHAVAAFLCELRMRLEAGPR